MKRIDRHKHEREKKQRVNTNIGLYYELQIGNGIDRIPKSTEFSIDPECVYFFW